MGAGSVLGLKSWPKASEANQSIDYRVPVVVDATDDAFGILL